MKAPWSGDSCIICLGGDALSEEYVIPAALGGKLKCDFLCKPCNDFFGSSFEAKARTDPAIRIAVAPASAGTPRTQEWSMRAHLLGRLSIHAYPDDNVTYRDIPVSALPAKVYLCRF